MTDRKPWSVLALAVLALVVIWAAPLPAEEDKPTDNPLAAEASETPDKPKTKDYAGKYVAEGTSNGGRKYKAMVEITREGEVYSVLWVLAPGEAYGGVGMTEGDNLCVGWSNGQMPGLAIYKPDKEGKLVGRWTAPGAKGKSFTETLTPVK